MLWSLKPQKQQQKQNLKQQTNRFNSLKPSLKRRKRQQRLKPMQTQSRTWPSSQIRQRKMGPAVVAGGLVVNNR